MRSSGWWPVLFVLGYVFTGCPPVEGDDDCVFIADDDATDDDSSVADDDLGGDDDCVLDCSDAIPCSGDYSIETIDQLDGIWLCRRIGGHLSFDDVISDVGWIEIIDLPCLESVDGGLSIGNNPSLVSLGSLSSLATVGDYLDIHENPALNDVVIPSLTHVGGWMAILDNECLVQAEAQAFADSLEVWGEVAVLGNEGPCD